MTQNQVAYWTLLETNRHNLEQEKIGHKQARAAQTSAAAAWKQAESQDALRQAQIGLVNAQTGTEATKQLLTSAQWASEVVRADNISAQTDLTNAQRDLVTEQTRHEGYKMLGTLTGAAKDASGVVRDLTGAFKDVYTSVTSDSKSSAGVAEAALNLLKGWKVAKGGA